MLVLVTLLCMLCGYFGWAINWKWQRRQYLGAENVMPVTNSKRAAAPLQLWPIFEQGYVMIHIFHPQGQQLAEGKKLFPEARVISNNSKELADALFKSMKDELD